MQFYKFEGFTVSENWSEENNDRRVMREKVRKISMKTNSFNQNQQRKAYAFVTDASEDTVTIGIIVRNYADVHKLISGYLQAIEMELKDTCLEEITFNNLRNMLSCADRYDYINDDDEVLEQFDLDKLNAKFGRSVEYGENILDCCDKSPSIMKLVGSLQKIHLFRNLIVFMQEAQSIRLVVILCII